MSEISTQHTIPTQHSLLKSKKVPRPPLTLKTQIHLKDILYDLKDELLGDCDHQVLTGQQRTQYSKIKENEANFAQLQDTLSRRKLTFSTFSFKPSDIEDDPYMKPIVRGIHSNKVTMSVTESWSPKQTRIFLKKSE